MGRLAGRMWSRVFVALFFSLLVACTSTRVLMPEVCMYTGLPISLGELSSKPFGHDESVEAFTHQLPGVEPKKMIRRNQHNPTLVDTIYEYGLPRGGQIMLYQTSYGQQFLLAAVIKHEGFSLLNGLRVGMSEEAVRQCVELPSFEPRMEFDSEDGMRTVRLEFDRRHRLECITVLGRVD